MFHCFCCGVPRETRSLTFYLFYLPVCVAHAIHPIPASSALREHWGPIYLGLGMGLLQIAWIALWWLTVVFILFAMGFWNVAESPASSSTPPSAPSPAPASVLNAAQAAALFFLFLSLYWTLEVRSYPKR